MDRDGLVYQVVYWCNEVLKPNKTKKMVGSYYNL